MQAVETPGRSEHPLRPGLEQMLQATLNRVPRTGRGNRAPTSYQLQAGDCHASSFAEDDGSQ